MDLKSLYEWYKESTKYPLTWLWSQGCPASSQPQTWFKSTSEIIRSARSVKQKGIIVPSSVISKLSDAIKKRRDVLKIYRSFTNSSNEGNAKHEAFVNRYLERLTSCVSRTDCLDWNKYYEYSCHSKQRPCQAGSIPLSKINPSLVEVILLPA